MLNAHERRRMFGLPALSYGLVHVQVRPNKLWSLIATGITAQGLNLDIGHLRHIRWIKDNNSQSAINNKPELTANGKMAAHNRWIAYNTLRGQYASAMEHAVLEQMWVDRNTCRYTDENGVVQNPVLADCAQGISAVKAIAIAQAQGQKIYTINQDNRATALPKLPVSGTVGAEIRSAIEAGKTVTFHEKQINAHGWTGYGFIIIDPETGAGAYLIEGKGNGGFILTYILEMISLIYAVLFEALAAHWILSVPLAAVFLVIITLMACSFHVSNVQNLYINSVSLLVASMAVMAFSLSAVFLIIPGIVVGLSLFEAIRNPHGTSGACRYVGL